MFELHITCTKDIDKLHIDFSDGTTVVTNKTNTSNANNANNANNALNKEKQKNKNENKENNLTNTLNNKEDLDWFNEDFSNINTEIIEKPNTTKSREVKVANELQHLDI